MLRGDSREREGRGLARARSEDQLGYLESRNPEKKGSDPFLKLVAGKYLTSFGKAAKEGVRLRRKLGTGTNKTE
jgi:hypothetical protein